MKQGLKKCGGVKPENAIQILMYIAVKKYHLSETTVILYVIYCTIVTYYMHCKICKVHTFFVKKKFCVTNIVFKTFVVNRINFMHYIYFLYAVYAICKYNCLNTL